MNLKEKIENYLNEGKGDYEAVWIDCEYMRIILKNFSVCFYA